MKKPNDHAEPIKVERLKTTKHCCHNQRGRFLVRSLLLTVVIREVVGFLLGYFEGQFTLVISN